ncbi:MAG: hypothetical protein K9K37_10890 [Desulfocapsa sp.]|nr:hypothetical protein [Desulfocapsa sp.]
MRLPSFILLLIVSLVSCSSEQEKKEEPTTAEPLPVETAVQQKKGCIACHSMSLDPAHSFECTVCHNGVNDSREKDRAHTDLIKRPGHPDKIRLTCGKCHQQQVEETFHSLHFTLKNEVNLVRSAFGATDKLSSLTDIPINESPATILELADDLLRRRCLRCHPYFSGDRYPAIARGTGCATCHLEFYEGKLVSHSFMKSPGDSQCLQCHYGNWVGFDYYGRYEHDMNDEYRTPYTTRYDYFRPFGIEFHQLLPDIHQQKGLVCVDCHGAKELMTDQGVAITCSDCHDKTKLLNRLPIEAISNKKNIYSLYSIGDGKTHPIPFMKDPAHQLYTDVGCQVCHAQWAFDDQETNLLRSDLEEYDDFSRLTVQGSFEVEKILKNNLNYEVDEIPHSMTDKISGEQRPGLWYKGFVTRRWEDVPIGRDSFGRLQVMRPVLDLRLSWIDEDDAVQFDGVEANTDNKGMRPYTPHTTGKAGLFYKERIDQFLRTEKASTL